MQVLPALRCFRHSCLRSSVLAAPHRACHACLPATYYVLLLPFARASAICVCAKSHARCPSTSLVLLFPRFHVRRIQHSLQAFMSAPHLATPTNFFLGLAFSGPLSAYATRACPTLGWPLSAYKPACAFLYTTDSKVACGVRVCKLLPCSALHSPRATLHFAALVAHANRVCPTLGASFSCLTRLCHACLPDTRLLFVLDSPPWPDKRHKVWGCVQLVQVLLALSVLRGTCSPYRTCHARLPATSYVLLLPFPRASAICVCAKSHARCPSTSCAVYNIPSRTHTGPAPQCRT